LSERRATTPRDPADRYSDRVDDYERHRPGYPPALIEWLRAHGALPPHATVADVGAGTGISSAPFLDAGCAVMSVEPNAAMRAAAERRFGDRPGFRSVAGRAEATTLDTASINLVAVGTAFHWFDRDRAHVEFARILKPSGRVALFWNVRNLDSTFMRGYEALQRAHCSGYSDANARERADARAIGTFFVASGFEQAVFPNTQSLDFDGLLGRLHSSSYAPLPGDPAHAPLVAALRPLFERSAENGRVAMLYDTQVYLGRLDS
jgi:SAM-dependent methyltransferase